MRRVPSSVAPVKLQPIVAVKPPWVAEITLPSSPQSARVLRSLSDPKFVPSPPLTARSLNDPWMDEDKPGTASRVHVAGEVIRPVSRSTMTAARLHESEIMHGREIWRGSMLEPEIGECQRDRLEFAHYRLECARESGMASREKARSWKAEKEAARGEKKRKDIRGGWSSRLRRSLGILHEDADQTFLDEETLDGMGGDTRRDSIHRYPSTSSSPRESVSADGTRATLRSRHTSPTVHRGAVAARSSTISAMRQKNQKAKANVPSISHFLQPFVALTEKTKQEQAQKVASSKKLGMFKESLKKSGASQMFAAHEKEWEKMPECEKVALKTAFERSDAESGKGTLSIKRLLQALRELDLTGRNLEELAEMRHLCSDFILMFGEVDFLSFAFAVVPQVRRKLRDLFRDNLRQSFSEEAGGARQKLTEPAAKELMMTVLGNPLAGVEASFDLRSCWDTVMAEEDKRAKDLAAEKQKVEEVEEMKRGGKLSFDNKDSGFQDEWETSPKRKRIDFGLFESLVSRTHDRYEALLVQRLMQVKAILPPELVECSGSLEFDLVPLHASFLRFDANKSSMLEPSEIRCLLMDFGFLSGKQLVDHKLLSIMEQAARRNKGALDFPGFVSVIVKIREELKQMRHEEAVALFEKYDRDGSGQLSVQEVSHLFGEMGLAPSCHRGQDEIKRILSGADIDGDGELNKDEFEHLVQLVQEKLKSITRLKEMELGLSLSFAESQIREYRDFFWDIDKDGSGTLDLQELRMLMQMLRQRIVGDDLRLLMKKIDKDNSGYCDFAEFLQLMAHLAQMMQGSESDEDEEEPLAFQSERSLKPRKTRLSLLAATLAHDL